ncbi:MAG: aldo/keto reductase [Gammaproteobacteria bacterium]
MKSGYPPGRATRRDLLKFGVRAALASALFPAPVLPAERMLTRPIPSSGEALPVIGLGTSRTFDVGDDAAGRSACRDVLEALHASGATLVDSSPMYRSAEQVTGDLAAELRMTDRLFWATKVWADGVDAGIEQMEESMRLFNTNQIDLMQIHNLRDWKTHMPVLRDWKAEGRIRYIGITHSRAQAFADLERVINEAELDFVQLNYSLAEREAEERLLPLCADKGIATLINRPFARGALFGAVEGRPVPEWAADFDAVSWGQFFLKFILSHPACTCLIPATRKVGHMVENAGAGFGALPNQDQREKMITFMENV